MAIVEAVAKEIVDEPIVGPVAPVATKLVLKAAEILLSIPIAGDTGEVVGGESYTAVLGDPTLLPTDQAALEAAVRVMLKLNGRIA